MTENNKFYNIAKFLDKHSLELGLLVLNGLGYTLTGIFFEINDDIFWGIVHSTTFGWIFLIIIFILNLYLGTKFFSKKKNINSLISDKRELSEKIQELENTIDELHRNSLEIFNEHLASLFYKLDLTENERISFYKYQNNKFHIVGRYSSNPILNEKNRKYYDSNEGFISIAFQRGHFHLNKGIPEFKNGQRQKYYNFIRDKCDIPIDTLKSIKMKSRSFYLYAFKDTKGLKRNSIIVFESLETDRFDSDEIDNILKSEKLKLQAFIERIESDLPELENAKKTGF